MHKFEIFPPLWLEENIYVGQQRWISDKTSNAEKSVFSAQLTKFEISFFRLASLPDKWRHRGSRTGVLIRALRPKGRKGEEATQRDETCLMETEDALNPSSD